MIDSDNYYTILGVTRNASAEDIKRGYKKAALRWHPDKNPQNNQQAERAFKQVAEAYGVLSDPHKRNLYDHGGREAVTAEPDGSDDDDLDMDDAFELFQRFFGGTDPFGMFDDMFSVNMEMDMMGMGCMVNMGSFGGRGGGRGSMVFSSSRFSEEETYNTTTTRGGINQTKMTVSETTVRGADRKVWGTLTARRRSQTPRSDSRAIGNVSRGNAATSASTPSSSSFTGARERGRGAGNSGGTVAAGACAPVVAPNQEGRGPASHRGGRRKVNDALDRFSDESVPPPHGRRRLRGKQRPPWSAHDTHQRRPRKQSRTANAWPPQKNGFMSDSSSVECILID
eukprot:TRINITY_DN25016_c0_g3_i1.p1 TRINITY_DN25016_c0_g3~~TRINITY_DN25016_c0_g3_i1.p1  ORF type:complete len:340 (-),score=44.06 TRINITY_DN25016_c0_g3_i1:55-1074(-)